MEPTENDLFLELSAKLTGIAVKSGRPAKLGDLEPRNSPVQLAPEFLRLVKSWEGGEPLSKLLKKFKEMQRPIAAESIREILVDREVGPLCKSIMKLWYLGAWYPPDRPRVASHVVSAQSYV